MSESATWFLAGFFLGVSVVSMIAALVWSGQEKGR